MQQAITPGTVINRRYQVQKKLPDSTSNHCFLAEDTDQSNRLVVISFPRMELQTLPGFTSSFDDACQQLVKARLNGLIKILDHGEHESQPYAVLQYVTHDTLSSRLAAHKLREKKFSVDEVLDWARPLAVSLDELHQLGYVHSSITPDGIFLDQKRQILLGDFIVEHTIQRLGASKQAIAALDIGNYLAPEYIKSHYTESYDQYLLATIIYEALAGRSHFHNPGSTEAYRRQVATKFPEPLLTHRPELVGASRILGKALERNPVKRFDTCREFVNQLGSAQVNPVYSASSNDKPVTVIKKVLDLDETAPAEPIITSIRSKRSSSRKKGFAWLALLLLGLGGGAYAVNHYGGIDQFKQKLTTAWAELSKGQANAPVIIPVDVAATNSDTSTTSDSATIATSPGETIKPDPIQDVTVSTGTEQSTEATLANASKDLGMVEEQPSSTTILGSADDANAKDQTTAIPDAQPDEQATTPVLTTVDATGADNDQESTNAILADDDSKLPENSKDLASIINDTLDQAQAEFKKTQQGTGNGSEVQSENNVVSTNETTEPSPESAVPAEAEKEIGDAVSIALQEAETEFMRMTSPSSDENEEGDQGVQTQPTLDNETSESGTEGLDVVPDTEVATSNDDAELSETVVEEGPSDSNLENDAPTPTVTEVRDFESLNLNEQIIAANKLADERAAEARRKAEQRRLAREAASANAARQAEQRAAAPTTSQPQSTGQDKAFEEMLRERQRIQAIKAEKTARIQSVTRDCVTGGKIHRQVIAGNLAYVKNCMSVGVSPNLTQSNKRSLLHAAAQGGYLNMAKLLIAKGADVNAKAADGKTPMDMATEKNRDRLVAYLRSQGGTPTR